LASSFPHFLPEYACRIQDSSNARILTQTVLPTFHPAGDSEDQLVLVACIADTEEE